MPGEKQSWFDDPRKCLFSQTTLNEWNQLSTDYVHASTVGMFKNRIDRYLVRTVSPCWTRHKPNGPLFTIVVDCPAHLYENVGKK